MSSVVKGWKILNRLLTESTLLPSIQLQKGCSILSPQTLPLLRDIFFELPHSATCPQPICIMRISFALFLAALVQRVVSTRNPLLQSDPDTVKDYVEWYNNSEGQTCEYVRSYFTSK
jgi:hypothetical protein